MNPGGETADQMVKMSLEGIEVAARLATQIGASASKSFAAALYAIIQDNKKIRGKTRMNALLKSGKELKVMAIRSEDLKTFAKEAKKYGVLYTVLRDKKNKDSICDVMVRAEDAGKISRIIDKFELATIDPKAIRDSILAQQKVNQNNEVKPLTEEQRSKILDTLRKELDSPKQARKEQRSDNPFEHNSNKTDGNVAKRERASKGKSSVRQELKDIKAQQDKNKLGKEMPIKFKTKNKGKVR